MSRISLTKILEEILDEKAALKLLEIYRLENNIFDEDTWKSIPLYRKLSYTMINGKIDMTKVAPQNSEPSLLPTTERKPKPETPSKTAPPKTATQKNEQQIDI